MQDYIVCNFSGGKDSTAMVLRMIELGEHIDEVVCCDTYKEFPAMYRHIEKVKKIIEEHGIKFTMLRSEKSFDYYMFERKPKRKNKSFEGHSGYSWAGPLSRWCTSKLKVDVINRYFAQLKKQYNLINCIGIAVDEEYRLERQYASKEGYRFPLVEWKWKEERCIQYCKEQGFDWEGLYDIFDRVSCWCCPLQGFEDLRKLRKHFPELWKELHDMDARTWRKFKSEYSVADLEKRFKFEDERLARGESITSREFYRKLKVILNKPLTLEEKNEERQISFFD